MKTSFYQLPNCLLYCFLAAAVGFLSSLSPNAHAVQPENPVSQEEYKVHATILGELTKGGTKIILEEKTFAYTLDEYELRRIKEVMKETIEGTLLKDFQTRNSVSSNLSAEKLQLKDNIYFLKEAERQQIKKADSFWDELFRRFPEARNLVSVSRVAFNESSNQAMVYVISGQGNLAGQGELIHLKKIDGKWKVQSRVVLVIA